MVEALEKALLESAGGPVSVSFDGTTTTWNHGDAMKYLQYWRRRVARENGRRPVNATIKLSG